VTLEMIRDAGFAQPDHIAWALEKGYVELVSHGRHKLTDAGLEALASECRLADGDTRRQ
jgi:hypothetical protein